MASAVEGEFMIKLLVASFVFVAGFSAHAGFLIEPYLGYDFGTYNTTATVGGGKSSSDTKGTVFGARLGYEFMIPWVAFDYSTGSGKASVSGASDVDYTKTGMGLVVGASLPIIRIWAGYGFSNKYTIKGTNGDPNTDFKGTYTKAGLGFSLIPFIDLNAEYIMNKFEKFNPGTSEVNIKDVYSNHDYNTVMISLSAPFSL